MHLELLTAIDEGKLTKQQAEILDQLAPGAFALHKSWGCARVAGTDYLIGQIELEFLGGRKQSMQMAFAATSLTPITESHVEAQRLAVKAGRRDFVRHPDHAMDNLAQR